MRQKDELEEFLSLAAKYLDCKKAYSPKTLFIKNSFLIMKHYLEFFNYSEYSVRLAYQTSKYLVLYIFLGLFSKKIVDKLMEMDILVNDHIQDIIVNDFIKAQSNPSEQSVNQ